MDSPRRHARGFSLVELLVAMTLGLLLVSGMISVFAGNKRSSDLNAAMANMQENARYALEAIADDVRHAGYQGCARVRSGGTTIRAGNTPPTTDFNASIATGSVVVNDTTWSPAPPAGFVVAGRDAVPGTQTIALQFGDPDARRLRRQMRVDGVPSPAGVVRMDRAFDNAAVNDLAIVSNCEQADLFRISNIFKNDTNLGHGAAANGGSANLGTAYGSARTIRETLVMLFRSNVYYIGDTGEENANGDAVHALYRQSLPYGEPDDNPPAEVVRGIENLRVAFGIRQATGNLRYVTANSGEYDAAKVESVQIGLLMASRDRIAEQDDNRTYTLAGQPVPPAGAGDAVGASHAIDRRHRLAFNTTVKIRNRRSDR